MHKKYHFSLSNLVKFQEIAQKVKSALPGTRALHSVKCVSPGVIY